MDAKSFYKEFASLVKEDYIYEGKTFLEIYKTNTSLLTHLINYIIVPQIIENAGFKKQNEYFRIDVIGWKEIADVIGNRKTLGLSKHLWDLKIAVEHENDKTDWTDELIKLAHIRCPLKVVIGYSPCDERNTTEIEKLKFAYDSLSRIKAFDPDADEEFLIIFGNCAPHHKTNKSYDHFDYRGYVLRKGDFGFSMLK